LLIRQFLTNARSTSWLSEQQESESGWREIADDSLAGYLVKAGGLGLSKQVESLIRQSQSSRGSKPSAYVADDLGHLSTARRLNASMDSTVTSTSAEESVSVDGTRVK